MILCLDAGNSRIKLALHDGQTWRTLHSSDTAAVRTDPTAWVSDWAGQLAPSQPTRFAACSVAGTEVESAVDQLGARLGLRVDWLRSSAAELGVRNGYAQPTQLGSDRWAALLAARAIQSAQSGAPNACVVVLAGTATTIDALDTDGAFRGGLILPGLTLMRQALAGATAQLPLAAGSFRPWPDNTVAAIGSGAIAATLGAIAGMRAQLGVESITPVPCLLAGGAAPALQAHLPAPVLAIPTLVLDGLLRYAQR